MGSEPDIRVATQQDEAALKGLIAAFRDHLRSRSPSEAEMGRMLPTLLSDRATEFALAVAPAGDAVGYTQTRFLPSVWAGGLEAQLEDLFVLPPGRRLGLGTALLRHALQRAAARRARVIVLQTNERNEAALRLYTREGFAVATEVVWSGGREIRLVRSLHARI